jgi:hypothetical protein
VHIYARASARADVRAVRLCLPRYADAVASSPLRSAGGSSSNNENPESSKSICRTLELAFRKVWLRLYTTGADENYSLALKEFVKATIAAFDKGYSLQALILELRRHEIETGWNACRHYADAHRVVSKVSRCMS